MEKSLGIYSCIEKKRKRNEIIMIIIKIIIIIWFDDTFTMLHLAKCTTNSKFRAMLVSQNIHTISCRGLRGILEEFQQGTKAV